jgi:hypothetical protein
MFNLYPKLCGRLNAIHPGHWRYYLNLLLSVGFSILLILILLTLVYFSFEDLFLLYTYFFGVWLYVVLPGFGFGFILAEFGECLGSFIYFLIGKVFRDRDAVLMQVYYLCFYSYWLLFAVSMSFRLLFLMDYLSSTSWRVPNLFPVAYCMDTDSEEEDGVTIVNSDTIFNKLNNLVTMQSAAFFSGAAISESVALEYYKLAEDIVFYAYDDETDMPKQLNENLTGKVCQKLLTIPKDCFILSAPFRYVDVFVRDESRLQSYHQTVFEVLLFKSYVNFIFFNANVFPFIAVTIAGGINGDILEFQNEPFEAVFITATRHFFDTIFDGVEFFFNPINNYLNQMPLSVALSAEFEAECRKYNWSSQILLQSSAVPPLFSSSSAVGVSNILNSVLNNEHSFSWLQPINSSSTSLLIEPLSISAPAVSGASAKPSLPACLESFVLKNKSYELLVSSLAKREINTHSHIQTIITQVPAVIPNFAQHEWNELTNVAIYAEKSAVDEPILFHYNQVKNSYIPNLVVVYKSQVYPEAAKVNGNFERLTTKNHSCFEKIAMSGDQGYYTNFLRNMGLVTAEKPIVDSRAMDESKSIVTAMELARFYRKNG